MQKSFCRNAAHRAQTLAGMALRCAPPRLGQMTPERVIETVRSRGWLGAVGPRFHQAPWRFTRGAPGQPRYVVQRGRERARHVQGSGPDGDAPHLLLEGMALCAYAIGAEQCYLFIRGEYPEATAILQQAIDRRAEAMGSWARAFWAIVLVPYQIGRAGRICGERPRCSRRSRQRGSHASSRRIRRRTGCSTSRRSSTTSKRVVPA